MLGVHHNAHTALAQESIDPVLVGEYLTYGNWTVSHGWSRYLRDFQMSFLVQTAHFHANLSRPTGRLWGTPGFLAPSFIKATNFY
jgi:hypothetical protein